MDPEPQPRPSLFRYVDPDPAYWAHEAPQDVPSAAPSPGAPPEAPSVQGPSWGRHGDVAP